jgi:hypothetical protein
MPGNEDTLSGAVKKTVLSGTTPWIREDGKSHTGALIEQIAGLVNPPILIVR